MTSGCDVLSSPSSSDFIINGGGEQLSTEEENSISELLVRNHSITFALPSLTTSLLAVAAATTAASACQQDHTVTTFKCDTV